MALNLKKVELTNADIWFFLTFRLISTSARAFLATYWVSFVISSENFSADMKVTSAGVAGYVCVQTSIQILAGVG